MWFRIEELEEQIMELQASKQRASRRLSVSKYDISSLYGEGNILFVVTCLPGF